MFSHAFTVLLLIVSVGVEGSEVGRNTLRSMQCLLTLMLPALYFFAASYLTPRLRRREEAPPSRKQNAANTAAAAATSTLQTPPSLDAPRLSLRRRPWGGGRSCGAPLWALPSSSLSVWFSSSFVPLSQIRSPSCSYSFGLTC